MKATEQNKTGGLAQASDEELMSEYQKGSDQAFGILYQRHSPKVYGFLRARLQSRSAADDVFQETFFKFHKVRARYNSSFPFLPWLFAVCRGVMIDYLRKEKRQPLPTHGEDPDQIPAETEGSGIGWPDLSPLSADQRRAIELRYGEGFSFGDIARKLNSSAENARQLVSRALRRLKGIGQKQGSRK